MYRFSNRIHITSPFVNNIHHDAKGAYSGVLYINFVPSLIPVKPIFLKYEIQTRYTGVVVYCASL